MNELALFAGAGGGILASKLLGWNTVGAVEIEKYPRDVLLQRQRDGILDPFPIWDDVRTFDGKPWRGLVDVVSGGFPCQDISAAGKGAGLAGDRSGLWFEYLRIVEEIQPRFVFAENSPNLRTRGLSTIIQGLTGLGYGVRWGVLGAWHIGANHKRNRMWVLAHANGSSETKRGEHAVDASPCGCGGYQLGRGGNDGWQGCSGESWQVARDVADTNRTQHERVCSTERAQQEHANACSPSWWKSEPALGRVANGVADRVDRLKAIGNGQVPAVAATAFEILRGETCV